MGVDGDFSRQEQVEQNRNTAENQSPEWLLDELNAGSIILFMSYISDPGA